ncbi:MAG TPA: protocatechuate 3,4-dioxygenase subunit beta [Devosia sp.]|jgi:protocatechuate 3,4-dioxygenase beta subunit|nr:protocatechuate 3,4-dioxygenase subunit beta [Devosia sp.]
MAAASSNDAPETGAFFPRDRSWHPPAFTPRYKTTVLRSPQRPLISFSNTLSEMTGPVFGQNILHELDNDLIMNFAKPGESAQGPRIVVHGRVLDERRRPVPGVLIEFWQANAAGRYRHKKDGYLAPLDPNFGGCGRTISAADGSYSFRTIKPGPYPWPNGVNDWRPAHIHFSIFGSGFAQRLITQMYFEGDPLIKLDPMVGGLPDPRAVEQLIAPLDMARTIPMDATAYKFDIVLRGRRSTLFENRLEGN